MHSSPSILDHFLNGPVLQETGNGFSALKWSGLVVNLPPVEKRNTIRGALPGD